LKHYTIQLVGYLICLCFHAFFPHQLLNPRALSLSGYLGPSHWWYPPLQTPTLDNVCTRSIRTYCDGHAATPADRRAPQGGVGIIKLMLQHSQKVCEGSVAETGRVVMLMPHQS
jgi:hypothetical protein